MVQHVLWRGSFESHVVSTFRHHLRVLLHLSDNLKLSNTRETTHVYLHQTQESGDHCKEKILGKLMLLLSFLCNSVAPDRPKMNDILVFENLKTDRLMSLVRRLAI